MVGNIKLQLQHFGGTKHFRVPTPTVDSAAVSLAISAASTGTEMTAGNGGVRRLYVIFFQSQSLDLSRRGSQWPAFLVGLAPWQSLQLVHGKANHLGFQYYSRSVNKYNVFLFLFTIWLVQDVVMFLTAGHGSNTVVNLKCAVDVPKRWLAIAGLRY